jgi:hypothetical protein
MVKLCAECRGETCASCAAMLAGVATALDAGAPTRLVVDRGLEAAEAGEDVDQAEQLAGAVDELLGGRWKLADGSPEGEAATPGVMALLRSERPALEACAAWATCGGLDARDHVLLCMDLERWQWLAEALLPPAEVARLQVLAKETGGKAMACGVQPRERLISLFLDGIALDLRAQLYEPMPAGMWRVLALFAGGLAVAGLPAPEAPAADWSVS